MNSTRMRTPQLDVPTPATPWLRKLFEAFKLLHHHSHPPPSQSFAPSGRPSHLGSAAICWKVTATLTREAVFGIVSIQAECVVMATHRTDALAQALRQLADCYPGYNCATVRADEGPNG